MKRTLAIICLACASPLMTHCDSGNVFEPAVANKKTQKDKGKAALQRGDFKEAISYLKGYLKEHPNDDQARSMLATALLKSTGVDELQLAAKLVDAQKDPAKSDWTAIVDVMPEGTTKNIENLQSAVETLSAIPASERTRDQNYQLAVASASLAVAVVKKNTDDGNGNYTPTDEKLATISDSDAELVVSSVATTAEASVASGSSTGEGTSKLATISEQIAGSEGATDREKLLSFLKAKRSSLALEETPPDENCLSATECQ